MLLTARKQLKVKDVTIGGGSPLICVPIVARDEQALSDQARKILAGVPDMIEWRVDFFNQAEKPDSLKKALRILNQTIGSIPLILTCRAFAEGGAREISLEDRLRIIEIACSTGIPDLVDIELSSGIEAIRQVVSAAGKDNVQTILSFHDFQKTPSREFIKEKLFAAQQAGGNIAKVAVMPQSVEDVLTLLEANLEARRGPVEIPIITMAMGKIGVITRMAGWLFGSDVTFAVGEQASAPGQIPIKQLRKGIDILRESIL